MANTTSRSEVVQPGPLDVLLGRGRTHANRVGNRILQEAVERNMDRYDAAQTRQEKTRITETIVQKITAQGGRFLKLSPSIGDGDWYEVDKDKARKKVSQSLRNLRQTKMCAHQATHVARRANSSSSFSGKQHQVHHQASLLHGFEQPPPPSPLPAEAPVSLNETTATPRTITMSLQMPAPEMVTMSSASVRPENSNSSDASSGDGSHKIPQEEEEEEEEEEVKFYTEDELFTDAELRSVL